LPYLQGLEEAFAKEFDPPKPTNRQTDRMKHPGHLNHKARVMMSDAIIFRSFEETSSIHPFNITIWFLVIQTEREV
jgi:hypothetical protein